jgi:hypothetical protein
MKTSLFLGTVMMFGAIGAPLSAAQAETVTLVATLNGASEPDGGDPDGAGTFSVEIDAGAGDFCYTVTSTGIAAPTMAHIHSGGVGVNGAPVITIDPKGTDMCIAVEPDVLKPIVATPDAFYVNIHNAEFPGGAIRGQLAKK